MVESLRPIKIVNDPGFRKLMKTGRPHHYIPSPRTVARDILEIFKRTRAHVAELLQVRLILSFLRLVLTFVAQKLEGEVHHETDAWSSPNHKSYMAVYPTFEEVGESRGFLLDLVEVAMVSHHFLVHHVYSHCCSLILA